jgi:ERCC4-related helicase
VVPSPRTAAPVPGVWAVEDGFVVHPLLASSTLRALPFQIDFARVGLSEDLLVVLPTGLGKTVIAALLSAEMLRSGPGKALFLAPTRPLVQQHAASFSRWLPGMRRAVFTGTVAHPRREGVWDSADVVFSTPEIILNDLTAERYDLKQVRFLILDEVHHAVGKYAYVPLAIRYRSERPSGGRMLGLTASPGGKDERIEEVVAVLGGPRVEARSRDDPGVREFVQAVDVEFQWVELPPEAKRIQEHLIAATREVGHKLQKMGYLRKKPLTSLSVKDLIALRGEIFARPGAMTRKFGPLFHQLILLHLHHAQERLETQGISPFEQYVERVKAKPKPSRGDLAFVRRPEVEKGMAEAKAFREGSGQASHPKLDALAEVIRAEMGRRPERPPRVLVFAQYRDTIQGIVERLEGEGWTVGRFVGQSTRDEGDRGMTQAEQGKVLRAFSEGRFPVLVASSVAEEGLDVPDVDLVVFFEAVPSEIRAIQRRGRTGRSSAGRVLVMLTRETRDVGYQRAEVRREEAMGRVVRRLSAAARRRSRPSPEAPPDPPESTR